MLQNGQESHLDPYLSQVLHVVGLDVHNIEALLYDFQVPKVYTEVVSRQEGLHKCAVTLAYSPQEWPVECSRKAAAESGTAWVG